MRQIHNYAIPLFLDQIPVDIPRPFTILDRPGMAAASVLFHARRFPPMTIRTVSTANGQLGAVARVNQFIALKRKRVVVNDGVIQAAGTVVLDCKSFILPAGLVIGGNAVGDNWEIQTTWIFLFDADRDER